MAVFMILTIFLIATKLSSAGYCDKDNEETYSYHGSTNGPRQWPRLFPACNGDIQSPIDIQTNNVRRDRHLDKLYFFGYNTLVKQATVVNDGHTVMITPQDNVKRGITVQGIDYNLQQLHFHWGSEKYPGGEHTLNGRKFEMEAHFVHNSSDGRTAVVGVLVQAAKKDNKAFKPIVEILSEVLYKDDSTRLKSSLYFNKLLPASPASYYGYTGSLTTPMCTEGVSWFVLQKTQTIGYKQLDSFLKIYSVKKEDRSKECLLAPNNRPLQNLNGRGIYASP
ncbi:putative carbonic anhydrase 3 [Argiope bruennichi]|uniref:putative carbonic anhydrase 3 n=1 Tax=Argiope bruennichi TaxID=94029 RepID=UPI0024942646|nr:putative carbonic anhydrase 3 [Argiope bruennichi]XP_055945231.1 putative carbonic anhydrase 3 [Argiope bruennichi]XP_055945232.1 putative carbonic anhydrase 3 [Argiope bruennichi]XP_055945233.1 putative carbonic anhydrase 3 [Argiope bruennichi]